MRSTVSEMDAGPSNFLSLPHLPVISCGTEHIVTVGSMENLLLWGKNHNMQLGFVTDIKTLPDPTFFQLKHDFYRICPVQVSCGPNFTAILCMSRQSLSKPNEKLLSEEEQREKRRKEEAQRRLFEESKQAQELVQKLKVLLSKGMPLLSIFKKKVVKFKSFSFVITGILGFAWNDEDIRSVIKAIDLAESAMDIDLTHLYERVLGRDEGRGIIYLFNSFSTDAGTPQFLTVVNDEQREYWKLETSTTPIKVLAGSNFILFLDSDRSMQELDFNRLDSKLTDIGLPRDNPVIDFCVFGEQRFAITSSHNIYAWGSGHIDGGRVSLEIRSPSTLRFSDVTQVFGGENFSAVTLRDRRVLIWGNFINKDMFEDDNQIMAERSIPTSNQEIIDISIQERSCLLLSKEGNIYIFGKYGDIPEHRTWEPIFIPGKYHYVDDIKVTQIASNTEGLCLALTQHGSLFTWTFDPRLIPLLGRKHSKTQPWREPCELVKYEYQFYHLRSVQMPGAEDDEAYKIIKVRCAYSNTVVLTSTNEVFITGSDYHGQLGQVKLEADEDESADEEDEEDDEQQADEPQEGENPEDEFIPEDASAFQPIPKFSGKSKIRIHKLACGAFHFLALDKTYNALFAWGLNVHGQLGLKHLAPKVRVPQRINDPHLIQERVISLACGDSHSLVLTEEGVYAFGNAECGRLGIGRTNNIDLMNTPVKLEFIPDETEELGREVKITRISAGQSHSLALTDTGKVYSWGSYWRGKLGHGSKEDVLKPKYLWKLSIGISCIACGWSHSIAVDKADRVWMWGEKEAIGLEADAYEPVVYSEVSNIAKVRAGNGYSLALSRDNRAFGWGMNEDSRLTKNAQAGLFEKKVVIYGTETSSRFLSVACGYNHSAALQMGNILLVWGSRYNGKLGVPMLDERRKLLPSDTVDEPMRIEIRLHREEVPEVDETLVEETKEAPETSPQPPVEPGAIKLVTFKPKVMTMKTKWELSRLQAELKGEKETQKPLTLVAMDIQLRTQLIDVYNSFSKMSDGSQDKSFIETLVSKTLVRIQNPPFKMKLESQPTVRAYIKNVKYTYKAIISTLQLHPCYLFNILKVNYDDYDMNKQILQLVYQGIEGDARLMHSALMCSRLLLGFEIERAPTPIEFIENPRSLYVEAVNIIMCSSIRDIKAVTKITKQIHSAMVAVIGDDITGLQMPKDMQSMAKDKRRAEGRRANLTDILTKMTKQLQAWVMKKSPRVIKFSPEVRWMFWQLRQEYCKKVGSFEITPGKEMSKESTALVKFVLTQTFTDIVSAVMQPTRLFITFESDQSQHRDNLKTLSHAVLCYIQSRKFEDIPFYEPINRINQEPLSEDDPRFFIFNELTRDPGFALTAEMTKEIFVHSFRNFDVQVTAPLEVLARIHKLIHANIDRVALSNNTYDVMRSIIQVSHSPITLLEEDRDMNLNLRLRTRTVRFQQSLVICFECGMAVAKELASPRFDSLLAVYEPLPEGSIIKLLSEMLVAGPTVPVKKSLAEYLQYYETSTAATRSKNETERLHAARDLVGQAAEIHFASEELRPTQEVIDDFKAKFLANVQNEVTTE